MQVQSACVGLLLGLATVLARVQAQCPANSTEECDFRFNLTEQLGVLNAASGQTYCFVCGSGQISGVTWRIDQSEVNPSDGTITSDGELIVFNTKCTFSSEQKSVSCTGVPDISKVLLVSLAVFKPPRLPNTYRANVSQSLTLVCDTSDSTETFISDVYWIDPSGNTQNEKNLDIPSVNRSDAGTYTCVVTAMDGAVLNASTIVIVQYPPIVSISNRSPYVIIEGQTLSLSCDYDALPPPTVSWSMEGSALDSTDPRVTITSSDTHSELTLTDTVVSDEGIFACRATNLLGSDNATVSVEVLPAGALALKYSSGPAVVVLLLIALLSVNA